MKLMLNMNVPRSLGQLLASDGHAYMHVADLGLAESADGDIVRAAREAGAVILTHDLDYGDLLAFSGETSPSVIVLCTTRMGIESVARRLKVVLRQQEDALGSGAVVVLGDSNQRIRTLPIGQRDDTGRAP